MENNNPYKKSKKSATELYQEKLKKRNETQDWIFGNSFGKPGAGAPLRDNNGNVISSLKSVADDNILKYDAIDFSRGNNNITVINHKIFNTLEVPQKNQINSSIYNNINLNNQLQNNINFINKNQNNSIINNNINNKYNYENQKNNNSNYINSSLLNIYSPYQTIQNSPYILVLSPSSFNYFPTYSNSFPSIANKETSQNLSVNNYNQNINNYNEQNISTNYFGIDYKKKEEKKSLEMQQYRNDLLSQIKDKKRKDEERKRKMEEDDKLEDLKNEEYFRIKKQQADEQARKLREKIKRRMQQPLNEEYGSSSHILEISKDFENFNKNLEGESPLNNKNNIEEIKEIEENNENDFLNIDNNPYDGNILLEEENYMKKIDDEYKTFHQALNEDIDKQIKNNPNEINQLTKDRKIMDKQNKLAEYLFGENISLPTPIKSINPLSHSFSQKPKLQIKNNTDEILYSNTFKNKTINLEDFFNKDENKNTKKYSKKDDEDNTTSSFYSTSTKTNKSRKQKNNNYQNQHIYLTKNNSSRHNSSASYSNYEKEKIKENKKDMENNFGNNENENLDENSPRSVGIKNITKTVLDKELINIQENKEDEEDEEDDEQNQKNKLLENKEQNKINEDSKEEIINNEELENEEKEENENVNEEDLENED